MKINLFLIPFVIILGLLFPNNDNKNNRRLYIIICSAVLLFVAAMRSPEYMTNTYSIDSANYKNMFEYTFDMGWNEFFATVYMRYFGGGAEEADVGYIALNKVIGLFTHDFAIFSLLADLLFFVPLGIILYRYSTNIYGLIFAFVYYISLIQVFLIGGGRQMFAVGLDMMALLAVIDRRRIRAIILFLVGVSIHFSSLLFAIPLLAIWFNIKPSLLKNIHVICFALFPIVLAFPNQMIQFMGNTVGMERYSYYGTRAIQGGSETFIFLIELLSLFCLVAIKRRDLVSSQKIRTFYVMAPLFTFFAPLIISNGSMIRISLYYHLFLALLVPFAIDCAFGTKNNRVVYVIAIGALSALSLAGGGMTYYFFWQI